MTMRGLVWDQGEANVDAQTPTSLCACHSGAMLDGWREPFGGQRWAAVFVQLSPHGAGINVNGVTRIHLAQGRLRWLPELATPPLAWRSQLTLVIQRRRSEQSIRDGRRRWLIELRCSWLASCTTGQNPAAGRSRPVLQVPLPCPAAGTTSHCLSHAPPARRCCCETQTTAHHAVRMTPSSCRSVRA